MRFHYIQVKQPIGVFYYCAIPAIDLIKIVRINPVYEGTEQPNRVQDRVKTISEYCSISEAVFPTPVVVNVFEDANIWISEDDNSIEIGDGVIGEVIDGQHRLLGIKLSNHINEFVLPVALMFGLISEEKAYIYSTINGNQEKENIRLIEKTFEIPQMRYPQKTVHEIARVLNNSEISPYYKELNMVTPPKHSEERYKMISQKRLITIILPLITRTPKEDIQKLKENKSLKEDNRCPFRKFFIEGKDDIIAKILINCFSAIKRVFPEEIETVNVLQNINAVNIVALALPSLVKKGSRDKNLTVQNFEKWFSAYKIHLDDMRFPFWHESIFDQKYLARILIDSVACMDIDVYINNLEWLRFDVFFRMIGELEKEEIYELGIALEESYKGGYSYRSFNRSNCPTLDFDDKGSFIIIICPFFDIATFVEKERIKDALSCFKSLFMGGMNANAWKGYIENGDSQDQERVNKPIKPTIYACLCEVETIINYYKQTVKNNLYDINGYEILAILYCKKGDYDKAIEYHSRVIDLNRESLEAYNNRGNAYCKMGDYDKAISDYTNAIRLKPGSADAYCKRGYAYNKKGDYDKAISDYTNAIRLKPDNADAYCERGYAYNKKGDYDKAILDYTEMVKTELGNGNYEYFIDLEKDIGEMGDAMGRVWGESEMSEDKNLEVEKRDKTYGFLIRLAQSITDKNKQKRAIKALQLSQARLAAMNNCLSKEKRMCRLNLLGELGDNSDIADLKRIINDANENSIIKECAEVVLKRIMQRIIYSNAGM